MLWHRLAPRKLSSRDRSNLKGWAAVGNAERLGVVVNIIKPIETLLNFEWLRLVEKNKGSWSISIALKINFGGDLPLI